jgi:hypothetical protein
MTNFHNSEYIEHLKRAAPNLYGDGFESKFNVGENDCPCFPGLFEFSQISAGGSLDAAIKLNHKSADICINWAGNIYIVRVYHSKNRWTSSCQENGSKWILLCQRYRLSDS